VFGFAGFLDFIHHPVFWGAQRFGNWICFRCQVRGERHFFCWVLGLMLIKYYRYIPEPLAFRPLIILINQYIIWILLHIFLITSSTVGATSKDVFLKCAHFWSKRTYTGSKSVFGVCCGGKGATGWQPKKSRVAAPSLLREGSILIWSIETFRYKCYVSGHH
jgi:hypothetical protein